MKIQLNYPSIAEFFNSFEKLVNLANFSELAAILDAKCSDIILFSSSITLSLSIISFCYSALCVKTSKDSNIQVMIFNNDSELEAT